MISIEIVLLIETFIEMEIEGEKNYLIIKPIKVNERSKEKNSHATFNKNSLLIGHDFRDNQQKALKSILYSLFRCE